MSSPQLPTTAIPQPLAEDDDDVSWALQTAGVQWGRGAYQDALVWLRRAAESAIELNAWSRGADLNASAARLEKLVAQATTQAAAPSVIPIGPPAVQPRPSFPVPQAVGSVSPAPGYGHPETSGYSSFPPKTSTPISVSSRNSVVIDNIEEAELELSDDELRELEAGVTTSDIPDGQRPSAVAGTAREQKLSFPSPNSEPLPAFALEPSQPTHDRPSRLPNTTGLPTFPLEISNRPPVVAARSQVPVRPVALEELPSFPLETGASSLPPVSKWPVHGRPSVSRVPPSPGLPSFEAVPPSRPYVDDGDDGAPGLDEDYTRQLESQRPSARGYAANEPRAITGVIAETATEGEPIEELEIQDAEEIEVVPAPQAKLKPSSVPRIPIRPAVALSTRPRPVTTPLPPAIVSARPAAVAKSSAPKLPSRLPLEPRLPIRQPISSVPTERKPDTLGTEPPVGQPISSTPKERKLEILGTEPRSVAPPSARGIEPKDLPTVSSPSLSKPPPAVTSEPVPKAKSQAPEASARAVSLRVEAVMPKPVAKPVTIEPLTPEKPPQALPVETHEPLHAEPLAVLPPVVPKSSAEETDTASGAELYGVRLSEVRGLSDLPLHALQILANKAKIERLDTGEEASLFSVALVLEGWVNLMPAIADVACATAVVGEVVFTEGTLDNGLMLRVVAGQDRVTVATWESAEIAEATVDCPWLADDLKLLADGFQALAGACLGPLGDRLDDSLRSIVTSRCEIRTLLPGEQLCAAKKPVPGMHIIGGGEVELVDETGRVMKTHGTGEFLYAAQVLAGGGAPYSARAGSQGALVLFAPRMSAHELLVSVPPLLEILAE